MKHSLAVYFCLASTFISVLIIQRQSIGRRFVYLPQACYEFCYNSVLYIKTNVFRLTSFGMEQIMCTAVALLSTNLAGIFTHWPREKAQRKAFIETRQCIEARLRTQRENQQQVCKRARSRIVPCQMVVFCFCSCGFSN